jgi:hypothetical protein
MSSDGELSSINNLIEEIEALRGTILVGFTNMWKLQYPNGLTPLPVASQRILELLEDFGEYHARMSKLVEATSNKAIVGMLQEEWGPSKDTNGGGHILKDSLEDSVEMIEKAMQGMNRETPEGLERENRKTGEIGGHNEEP